MSNSFNISVKPEIAAVKADTADIRTDVTAIHDTDLPSVKTDTADIRSDVTAIHDTDLPAVDGKIDGIIASINAIRTGDFPNVQAHIDAAEVKIVANETKIDSILDLQIFNFTASDTLLFSADNEVTSVGTGWGKHKEIFITFTGWYRISFDLKTANVANSAEGRVYKDAVGHGTVQSTNSTTYVNKTEDLFFNFGDLIQLYLNGGGGGLEALAQNFRIKGTSNTLLGFIILD